MKQAIPKPQHAHSHGHVHVKKPEFDPHIHMDMSEQDKTNLIKYHQYEDLKWMEETHRLYTGDSFIQEVNSDLPNGQFQLECLTDSYFAILSKREHEKLLKKI